MKKNQYVKYYKDNNKYKNNEVDKTFFDKLFFRIFLSSILLLMIVGVDKVCSMYNSNFNINMYLTENINFIKILKGFNNTVFKFIDEDTLKEVYDVDFYSNVSYSDGVNQIKLVDSNGVNNLVSGYVIKIEKNNKTYNIYIKGIDGLDYCFIGLSSIDVSIYEYVEAGEILGLANFDDIYEIYFFDLIIKDKEEVYSYFDKAN